MAVINETMVRLHFKDEEPIGKRILVQEIVPGKTQLGPEIPWEIVGVVADEKVDNLGGRGDNPGMYVSNEQSPVYFQALVVRTAMDPAGLRQALTRAVHEINKDQTLTEVKTLDQIKTESMATKPAAIDAAHGIRGDRGPAGGDRDLRRDFVFGGAADP